MKSNKGLALIVVLWVITLLTIMASSFALTIQRESAIISGIKEKAEAQALAEAGINYAVVMLFNTNAFLPQPHPQQRHPPSIQQLFVATAHHS
jgi:general secretion pathway protein K